MSAPEPEQFAEYERVKEAVVGALSPGRYIWTSPHGVNITFSRDELAQAIARNLTARNDGSPDARA